MQIEQPETKYAKSGDLNIAYQVVGDGPVDLIFVPGWVSNIEYSWEHPSYAKFYNRLASFSRLILFDKRGTGLSDRVADSELPTLEQRMDDVRAVLDTVNSERAVVFGFSEGGNMSVLFAATYPERTIALITFGIFACRIWSEDYPWAPKLEQRKEWLDSLEEKWGGPVDIETLAPSAAHDKRFRDWWATYLRRSASPKAVVAIGKMNSHIDIRNILSTVRVPTLILHRSGDKEVNIEEGYYIRDRIPGAKFIELDGEDHFPIVGDFDSILNEVEEFITGVRPTKEPDRVLATVVFTDIVGSTDLIEEMGDRKWKNLLEDHRLLIRERLREYRGNEIETIGDGFLATFDGPARAIKCSSAIIESMKEIGIELRVGVHTGECEILGDGIAGIAVHIAARVASKSNASEVVVSRTVKDLVAGSGIQFEDRGYHALKGIDERWHLFTVK